MLNCIREAKGTPCVLVINKIDKMTDDEIVNKKFEIEVK